MYCSRVKCMCDVVDNLFVNDPISERTTNFLMELHLNV